MLNDYSFNNSSQISHNCTMLMNTSSHANGGKSAKSTERGMTKSSQAQYSRPKLDKSASVRSYKL